MAGAWRPTAGAGLPRTLGHAEIQRASIAAMFSFCTRTRADSGSAATRKTGQTAEDNATPEGPANINTGTGFASAKIGHALRRWQRTVAHGQDEEHPRYASAVARGQRSRYWRRGARSLAAQATQDDFSRRHQPWQHGHHRGGSYARTRRVRSSVPRRQRGLTCRSTGAPTAGQQRPGRWYAVQFHRPGRCRPAVVARLPLR